LVGHRIFFAKSRYFSSISLKARKFAGLCRNIKNKIRQSPENIFSSISLNTLKRTYKVSKEGK